MPKAMKGNSRLQAGRQARPGMVKAGAQCGCANGPRSRRPNPLRRARPRRLGPVTGPRHGIDVDYTSPSPAEIPAPRRSNHNAPAPDKKGGSAMQTRPLWGGFFCIRRHRHTRRQCHTRQLISSGGQRYTRQLRPSRRQCHTRQPTVIPAKAGIHWSAMQCTTQPWSR